MKKWIAGAAAVYAAVWAGQATAQEKLTVWWVKGFYKAEDDALFAAIKKFEDKSGVKVELSQYAIQDMIPKTVAALDSGTVPDVAYADTFDFQVTGRWAFDGTLEDISDIIEPMKGQFAPNTIETTFLTNDKTKKKAYYAYPIKQQTMHIADLEGHAGAGRLQGERYSQGLEGATGPSGATRCSLPIARPPARAPSASASPWASTPRTASTPS